MSKGLLFVCGFPSSGTDLMRNILNAHQDIRIAGEFLLLPTLAKVFGATVAPEQIPAAQEAIRGVDIYGNLNNRDVDLSSDSPVEFEYLFAQMLFAERTAWTGSKTPQNTENLDRLLQLFPSSKYVIVIRDVRDVALSWRSKWGKSMLLSAHKWQARMGNSLKTTGALPDDRYLYVSFEDVLDDLEREARRICDFLGVPFDPNMLNYQDFVAEHVPGKINFGQPIIKSNRQKWAKDVSTRDLERIEEIAQPIMERFGYSCRVAKSHRPITRLEAFLGILRDAFALLAVGNRSLKRRRLAYRMTQLRVLWAKLKAQISGKLN